MSAGHRDLGIHIEREHVGKITRLSALTLSADVKPNLLSQEYLRLAKLTKLRLKNNLVKELLAETCSLYVYTKISMVQGH